VDISPSAWGQLATLTTDDYVRIRVRLDAIAAMPHPEVGSTGAVSVVVDEYRVFYAVDAECKRLTLVEVARQGPPEK
jgi:mRNA-degrading endonuclease RelE of RelBE toxin-antitoxin system